VEQIGDLHRITLTRRHIEVAGSRHLASEKRVCYSNDGCANQRESGGRHESIAAVRRAAPDALLQRAEGFTEIAQD